MLYILNYIKSAKRILIKVQILKCVDYYVIIRLNNNNT
jgi:hypothetical protein